MNDIHNLTYNNSNNNNNNNSDSTGTTTTPMGSSFDYLQDKIITRTNIPSNIIF